MAGPNYSKYNQAQLKQGAEDFSKYARKYKSLGMGDFSRKLKGYARGATDAAAGLEKERTGALDQKRNAISAAYTRLEAAPGPTELAKESTPAGPLPQFEIMRQRAQRQAAASGQQTQDVMRRRLAAAGTLDSGAGIKALQVAQEQSNQQAADALEGVNAQEAAAQTEMGEAVKNRNFQRETFNEEARFKDKMFRADTFAKFQQLERQIDTLDLSQLEFQLRQEEQEFNKRVAEKMMQSNPLEDAVNFVGGVVGLGSGLHKNYVEGKK